MSRSAKGDRRGGYSFVGHLRRVLATRGVARVAGSLGATALIAVITFGRCKSSSITGPSSRSSTTTKPTINGGASDLGGPSQYGPIHIQAATLPPANPCTMQGVLWDGPNSFTNISSSIQMGTDGQLHVRFHMNTQALGTSDPNNNPNNRPALNYNGSQEQDSQDFVVGTTSRYHAEWNLKVMAKGNDGTLFDSDDFYLHMVMDSPVDVSEAVISSSGYCR